MLYPKRSVIVSTPVNMDDGSTRVLQGYRVQHHLSIGTHQGRPRFDSSVTFGEVAALAIRMSWECAPANLPHWGAKEGIQVGRDNSLRLSSSEYQYGICSRCFLSWNQNSTSWDRIWRRLAEHRMFKDIYSRHEGRRVPEIVPEKPVAAGGGSRPVGL
ncbi:MAG: hypothetical protein JO076_15560 [Verrucomicrobia bacterium]|nr:hypothetical protein [Verrucomicrobiota bacterium]